MLGISSITGKGKKNFPRQINNYQSKYPTSGKAEISTGPAACFPRHCCCRANPCDSMDPLNPSVAKWRRRGCQETCKLTSSARSLLCRRAASCTWRRPCSGCAATTLRSRSSSSPSTCPTSGGASRPSRRPSTFEPSMLQTD